jgi:hypothetical protein
MFEELMFYNLEGDANIYKSASIKQKVYFANGGKIIEFKFGEINHIFTVRSMNIISFDVSESMSPSFALLCTDNFNEFYLKIFRNSLEVKSLKLDFIPIQVKYFHENLLFLSSATEYVRTYILQE